MRQLTVVIAVTGCVAAFGVAGCGSSSSSSSASSSAAGTPAAASTTTGTTHLATAKFLLHAGLALGAFHHFIYGPIKAGDLKHPFEHKLTLVKAGLAAVFVYHELKLAAEDAKSSKLLSPLVAPLTAAASKLSGLKGSITSGGVNPADITSLNSSLDQIKSTAASKGQSITESIPGASQLAAGL
ncbi:MAG: hypothetical protein ACLPV4_01850 [Solirubrobacteraceae bacterium]